jgi:hypothetical protein
MSALELEPETSSEFEVKQAVQPAPASQLALGS